MEDKTDFNDIKKQLEQASKVINTSKIEEIGNIKLYFSEKTEWNQHMNVFYIKDWQGEPQETEEMAPQWYNKSEIPYESMWVDDIYWLPKTLDG